MLPAVVPPTAESNVMAQLDNCSTMPEFQHANYLAHPEQTALQKLTSCLDPFAAGLYHRYGPPPRQRPGTAIDLPHGPSPGRTRTR